MSLEFIFPFIVVIVFFVAYYFFRKNTHYECPECGTHFQAPFLSIGVHLIVENEGTCPNCGYTGMMKTYKGKN